MCQLKRQFTQQQLCELSLPIIERLKPLLVRAQNIVAYYSLVDEVDTHYLIDDLLAAGKSVYLPKVVSDEDMVLCRYTGAESLREGAFGIMEPAGTELSVVEAVDVVLVPGMAFDVEGNRLGRGKGYYDRFLKSLNNPRPRLIGVCFDFQEVDVVPTEPTDVKVDVVV
jgi:5-formyltetrahydrofolate cyclo-ligase